MILGITGGTGCGKTTLLNVLKERGAVVLDCDAIYHELLTRDASLLAAIEERSPARWRTAFCSGKSLGIWYFPTKRSAGFEQNHPRRREAGGASPPRGKARPLPPSTPSPCLKGD